MDETTRHNDSSVDDAHQATVGDSKTTDSAALFWLTPGSQWIAATLLILGIGLLGLQWTTLTNWGQRTVEPTVPISKPYNYRIELNKADWFEFSLLDGIGPTYAQRIVDYRETHGPFESIDDLTLVDGIGPKRLESMRPWLKLGNPE